MLSWRLVESELNRKKEGERNEGKECRERERRTVAKLLREAGELSSHSQYAPLLR